MLILVCRRLKDMPFQAFASIPGNGTAECSECKETVALAPASQKTIAAGATILCHVCQKIKAGDLVVVTGDTIREMVAHQKAKGTN